jgi:hypothetical protein
LCNCSASLYLLNILGVALLIMRCKFRWLIRLIGYFRDSLRALADADDSYCFNGSLRESIVMVIWSYICFTRGLNQHVKVHMAKIPMDTNNSTLWLSATSHSSEVCYFGFRTAGPLHMYYVTIQTLFPLCFH